MHTICVYPMDLINIFSLFLLENFVIFKHFSLRWIFSSSSSFHSWLNIWPFLLAGLVELIINCWLPGTDHCFKHRSHTLMSMPFQKLIVSQLYPMKIWFWLGFLSCWNFHVFQISQTLSCWFLLKSSNFEAVPLHNCCTLQEHQILPSICDLVQVQMPQYSWRAATEPLSMTP